MSWNENYASDVDYTAGFFQELSPVFLNFVCVLNGMEPVAIDKPYTYCELGCGRGLTANILAASNPLGDFYAVDFMPSHIADARQLANEAQLENMTFLENSFTELAAGKVDLPQFDFITLHGVYSWVSQENRRHIVNFIHQYLKPGGIVYVSYNALPGWASRLPLQRLLIEHAHLHPGPSDVQSQHAIAFAMQLTSVEAGYFTKNPDLAEKMQKLKTDADENVRYLVHEYMPADADPLYHIDITRDFSRAKLDYIGSADLSFTFLDVYLPVPQKELLNSISNDAFRETVKDYLLNASFRKDVFVRGTRKMSEARQIQWLEQVGVALLEPLNEVVLPFVLQDEKFAERKGICAALPLLEALAVRPHTLTELAALPAFHGKKLIDLAKVAALLSGYDQTAVYFNHHLQTDARSAHKMNRAVAAKVLHTNDYNAFASPLLGSGVIWLPLARRMLYHLISLQNGDYDEESIVQQLLVSNIGVFLIKHNENIEPTEITNSIKNILKEKVPIWKQLGML
jgi:SAM-dependent methyltransferase